MNAPITMFEADIGPEEYRAVRRVLDSGWFIGGKETEAFEHEFSAYTGTKHAVGCSNGTAALVLSLEALGIREGDEVIVPSHTAFPTVQSILNVRARPVFADIDEDTYTLDPKDAQKKITKKTKAIIAVHLYGHPADLDSIQELTKQHNIHLIEDCAQAAGATYKGKKVGSFGDIGCFSFYPTKNMTVCGDGGMVVTNNPELREKVFMLKNHGMKTRYENIILGHNFRISEIAAALGREQLKKLPDFNKKRRSLAHIYTQELEKQNLALPVEKKDANHAYHLYVVRTPRRDALKNYLQDHNIKTEIHYPTPGHLQHATPQAYRTSLPVTERVTKEILSLPLHTKLTEEHIKTVSTNIKQFLAAQSPSGKE